MTKFSKQNNHHNNNKNKNFNKNSKTNLKNSEKLNSKNNEKVGNANFDDFDDFLSLNVSHKTSKNELNHSPFSKKRKDFRDSYTSSAFKSQDADNMHESNKMNSFVNNKHSNSYINSYKDKEKQFSKNMDKDAELLVKYSQESFEMLKSAMYVSVKNIYILQIPIKSHLDLLSVFNSNSNIPAYRHINLFKEAKNIEKLMKRWYKMSVCKRCALKMRDVIPIESDTLKFIDKLKKQQIENNDNHNNNYKNNSTKNIIKDQNKEDIQKKNSKSSLEQLSMNEKELLQNAIYEDDSVNKYTRVSNMFGNLRDELIQNLFTRNNIPEYTMSNWYNIKFQALNGIRFDIHEKVNSSVKQTLMNILQEVKILCHIFLLIEEYQLHVYATIYKREGSTNRIKSTYLLLGTYAKIYTCLKSYLLEIKNVYDRLRLSVELLPEDDKYFKGIVPYEAVCSGEKSILPLKIEEYCGNIMGIIKPTERNYIYRDLPRVEDFLRARKNKLSH